MESVLYIVQRRPSFRVFFSKGSTVYTLLNGMALLLQEGELEAVKEQLQKSEGMRHRMNDEVTELQGRLAIEEQRSRFCTVL